MVQDGGQTGFKYAVRVMTAGDLIVMLRHFFPDRWILEDFHRFLYSFVFNEIIETDDTKPFRLDIGLKDGIVTDDKRTAVVECLQESVPETLNRRWVGD